MLESSPLTLRALQKTHWMTQQKSQQRTNLHPTEKHIKILVVAEELQQMIE